MEKRKVIHDCDLTFGVKGCDVDDGMALMLLLGSPEVELLGATTSYGNNEQEVVWEAAQQFLRDLGRNDIDLHQGLNYDEAKQLKITGKSIVEKNDAANFLVDTAREHKGEVELLVTGTTSNLLAAHMLDQDFFSNLKSLTFMGGITEELVFAKGTMDEMNLSRDYQATVNALAEYYKAHKDDEDPRTRTAALLTGNNCLKALFTREEYRERLAGNSSAERFIRERTDYWFDDNDDDWGIQGFYNWDVTAAAYLLWPELFDECLTKVWLSEEDMKTGYIRMEEPEGESEPNEIILYLPIIKEEQEFRDRLYRTWKTVEVSDGK